MEMSDSRTTELREKLDELGIEHEDASYKRKVPITVWQSNGATFCFVESSDQTDLHIENPTTDHAIAATLGNGGIPYGRGQIEALEAKWRAEDGMRAQPPIGAVIMKGACAVDAKGADVFCGDVVVDSFCNEHKVIALEPIDADHCWLIDESKVRLVPHLVEKVG